MDYRRVWLLDLIRGLAIIGMLVYHLIFDLYLLGQSHLNPFSPPLIVFARLVASLFLFLVRSPLLLTAIALIFLLIPQPPPLPSFDYYPLFPWFGVVLLGYLSARYLPTGKQTPPSPLIKPFLFLGRHSLAVYLLHQPLLLFSCTSLAGFQMFKILHLTQSLSRFFFCFVGPQVSPRLLGNHSPTFFHLDNHSLTSIPS